MNSGPVQAARGLKTTPGWTCVSLLADCHRRLLAAGLELLALAARTLSSQRRPESTALLSVRIAAAQLSWRRPLAAGPYHKAHLPGAWTGRQRGTSSRRIADNGGKPLGAAPGFRRLDRAAASAGKPLISQDEYSADDTAIDA